MFRIFVLTAVCTLLRFNFVACRFAPTITHFFKFTSSVDIRKIFTNRDISSSAEDKFLLCRARGQLPLTFTFYKNGQQIFTRTAWNYRRRTQILKIGSKNQKLRGIFQCMVNNGKGRDSSKLILGHQKMVTSTQYENSQAIGIPPKITKVRALRYMPSLQNGTKTLIVCEATGTLPLSFTWYKGNTIIKTESKTEMRSSSLVAKTKGLYSCKVTNTKGKDFKEITVVSKKFYNSTRRYKDKMSLVPKSPASYKHDVELKYFPYLIAISAVLTIVAVCLLLTVIYQRRKIQKILSSPVPFQVDNLDLKSGNINGMNMKDTPHKTEEQQEITESSELGYEKLSFPQMDFKNKAFEESRKSSCDASSIVKTTLSAQECHNHAPNKKAVKNHTSFAQDENGTTYDYAYQDKFFLSPETIAAIHEQGAAENRSKNDDARRSPQLSNKKHDSEKNYNYAYDHAKIQARSNHA